MQPDVVCSSGLAARAPPQCSGELRLSRSFALGWRNGVKPEYLHVSVGVHSLTSFGGFALNREAPHQ